MTERQIVFAMAMVEGIQLARLVDDFRALAGPDRDVADPALVRLTPSPYPEDDDAALSFAESTRDELLDRRVLDADTVRLALTAFPVDTDSLTEAEALAPQDVTVMEVDVDAWLRTLTAIRLVIAERLGIVSDDQHDESDDRFGVYDWLGYRLEMLIQAADDLDR